jgi:SAM-dependent methyltransferase
MIPNNQLSNLIESLLQRHAGSLGDNAAFFMRRVYSKGIDVYQERLMQYGFTDFENVLDAGCGFGQWSLALAQLNKHVTACDISAARIDCLLDLASCLKLSNLTGFTADLSNLSIPDECMDAVYCYGVLFLTPWKEALQQLVRVLRPGGLLYLNANGFGWYQHLWMDQPNKTSDYDPQLWAANAMLNTWNYQHGKATEPGVDILISPDELMAELMTLGCGDIEMAAEGCLRTSDLPSAQSKAFFKGEYGGNLGVYEMLARKLS